MYVRYTILHMKKTYGTIIPHLIIQGRPAPYGVVNEREVRAVAGIMFAIGLSAFWLVLLGGYRELLYIIVPLFFLEFLLKVVVGPNVSLFRWMVLPLLKKQQPEYVGAIQKRFAWALGLGMATVMLILVASNVFGMWPFLICSLCLIFMFLESVFGMCVGCQIYGVLLKKGILQAPEHKPACAAGVCEIE